MVLLSRTNEEIPRVRMLFKIDQCPVESQSSDNFLFTGLDLLVSGDLENEKLRKVFLDWYTGMRVRREVLCISLQESLASFDGGSSRDLQKRIDIAL